MIETKPVASLRTSADPEAPSIEKYFTQRTMEGTFGGLLEYLGDSRGDEYNPALDTEDEMRIADRTLSWLRSNKAQLSYIGSDNQLHRINLEETVGENIGRMLRRETATVGGELREIDKAVLIYRPEEVGGVS